MSEFAIICPDEQMKKIEEHCFSETQIEVGGFLIGKIEDGKTTVTSAVPAKHTVGQSTQLTFTHDSWNAIYKYMEKRPADERLIGWYHSHPNFGVFLSEHDQFIQNNFFKSPGQITIVVDPIRGRRGWFHSVSGQIVAHGEEVDTLKKKLGTSSTNADANMDVVLGTRPQSASNLKIIGISALMAVFSFTAGLLVNNLSKSNESTTIKVLQSKVDDLTTLVQSATFTLPSHLVQNPVTPQPVATKTHASSTKTSKPKKEKGARLPNQKSKKPTSSTSPKASDPATPDTTTKKPDAAASAANTPNTPTASPSTTR